MNNLTCYNHFIIKLKWVNFFYFYPIIIKSLKTLECNFPSASGMNKAIRTGNLLALDMANPQLSVHHDPRADY